MLDRGVDEKLGVGVGVNILGGIVAKGVAAEVGVGDGDTVAIIGGEGSLGGSVGMGVIGGVSANLHPEAHWHSTSHLAST